MLAQTAMEFELQPIEAPPRPAGGPRSVPQPKKAVEPAPPPQPTLKPPTFD
jgi:hypothetical protein